MLAAAICLERYMKHDLTTSSWDSIEKDWLKRWTERLGNPDRTPRQVMRTYVEDLDITVTHPLPELPEKHAWLAPLLKGLMDKDPAMRFRSGAAFVEAMQRLVAEAHSDDGQAALGSVTWQATGEMRAGASGGAPAVWLHLHAEASIPLTCQRCLGPVDKPLLVDRWFRFVADEATADAEDEDSEEDVLVFQPAFNLRELVEDELIMAQPLVPMHEVCPVGAPASWPGFAPTCSAARSTA